MARIIYPRDSEGVFKLFSTVFEKHLADGDKSDLKHHELDVFKTKNERGKLVHDEANKLAEESQQKREERNLLQAEIDSVLHKIGTYLKGKYPDKPRKLSDWGFSIDDSPRSGGSSDTTNKKK